MRYKKGSIALSESFDLPLLLHVRNTRCVALDQLRSLLNYGSTSLARRRMAWRIDRLVHAQYLNILEQRVRGDKICTITPKGLEYLEMCGHGLISVHSSMRTSVDFNHVMHWLELVDIRLILLRSGVMEERSRDKFREHRNRRRIREGLRRGRHSARGAKTAACRYRVRTHDESLRSLS
jgi:hypothetical protein